jgi:ribosomal protein S27E
MSQLLKGDAMAPLTMQCPECQTHLVYKRDERLTRCKGCGQVIQSPAPFRGKAGAEEGKRRKDEALRSVAETGEKFLEQVRPHITAVYARRRDEWIKAGRPADRKPHISVNEGRRWQKASGIDPPHPKVWGSLFKFAQWVPLGQFEIHEDPACHGRKVERWGWARDYPELSGDPLRKLDLGGD